MRQSMRTLILQGSRGPDIPDVLLGRAAGRGRVRCGSSPLSCAGWRVPDCSAVRQARLGSTEKLRGKPMQGLATSTMVRSEVSPMFHECLLGYPTP